MDNTDILIGGLTVAVVTSVMLLRRAHETSGGTQPRYETKAMMEFPVWHPGDPCGGVQHHSGHEWHARETGHGHVATRHRYPVRIGGNVTGVMHHGFSSLARPAPQDGDWIYNPPSVEAV